MRMLVNFIDVQTHEAKASHYDQIVPIPKVGDEVNHAQADRTYTVTRVILHYLSGGLEAHTLVQPTVGGRFEIAMKPV
jgi:hypothetical protein